MAANSLQSIDSHSQPALEASVCAAWFEEHQPTHQIATYGHKRQSEHEDSEELAPAQHVGTDGREDLRRGVRDFHLCNWNHDIPGPGPRNELQYTQCLSRIL